MLSAWAVGISWWCYCLYFFSEELKEADCVKTKSLQMLQDENNKLTQELDNSHKGQSDLLKVQHIVSLFDKLCFSYWSADHCWIRTMFLFYLFSQLKDDNSKLKKQLKEFKQR